MTASQLDQAQERIGIGTIVKTRIIKLISVFVRQFFVAALGSWKGLFHGGGGAGGGGSRQKKFPVDGGMEAKRICAFDGW